MPKHLLVFFISVFISSLLSTGFAADNRISVTTTRAQRLDFTLFETASGTVETENTPLIAAQTAGALTQMRVHTGDPVTQGDLLAQIDPRDYQLQVRLAQTDIKRIQTLIHAQQLKSERHHNLMKKEVSAQSVVDDIDAQLGALRAQLASARIQLDIARHNLQKTKIISPIDGIVDQTLVSAGDYVKPGTPIARIANVQNLLIRLYFPQNLQGIIRARLPLHLTNQATRQTIETRISHIKPLINPANRALEAIIRLPNPGNWQAGSSVSARVQTAVHHNALIVPEKSVVMRPAGTVVYRIVDQQALEQKVTIGTRQNGQVEIIAGLRGDEVIALDGAGFLSHKARVRISAP